MILTLTPTTTRHWIYSRPLTFGEKDPVVMVMVMVMGTAMIMGMIMIMMIGIGADASASASAVVNVKGESFLQDNISRNDSIHNPMLSAVSSQVSVSTAAASASASVAVVASASSASRSTSRFHTPILVQSQGYGWQMPRIIMRFSSHVANCLLLIWYDVIAAFLNSFSYSQPHLITCFSIPIMHIFSQDWNDCSLLPRW